MKKTLCIVISLITCFLFCFSAYAAKKEDLNKDKKENENRLNQVNEQISSIEDEKSQAQAGLDASQALLVELLANVEIIKGDIENKEAEIEEARIDYEAAEAEERRQYKTMCARIKYMYENGNTSSDYIEILLKAESLSDAINKAEYAEKLYEYDRELLENYQASKERVAELQASLDEEMAELQEIEQEYEEQEKNLNATIEEQKRTVEDFSSKLADAKSKAKAYQKKIDEDNAQIAKIAEAEKEAARKAAEEKKKKEKAEKEKAKKEAEEEKKKNEEGPPEESGEEPTESPKEDQPVSGGTGQEIANYARQFVGNPYVPGGTSLTDGCDCSGFTMSVYKHFGYSIPRNSGAQAAYGRGVSYEEAQPGDIFCYAGHVGIYLGNGQIVHASTQATGIKISNALYRSVISIRRIV